MLDASTSDAIAVFTGKSVETLLSDAGSGSWLLNEKHARRQRYLVCVRNAPNAEAGAGEPHGSAFMVGKVSGLVRLAPVRGIDRWRIAISEYALHDGREDVWHGRRNPVRYATLGEFGIDPEALTFKPVPEGDPVDHRPPLMTESVRKLTIPEAKAGLAATLGISPDQIEITIKS